MKQNQAPTEAFSCPRSFQNNRQAFGLAQIWPGCRSYAVDCLWTCESSEVSTSHPLAAWQYATPTAQLKFRPPPPMRVVSDGRQQSLKPGPASGPGTLPVRLQCHFLRFRRVRVGARGVMGCCAQERERERESGSSIGCAVPSDTQEMSVLAARGSHAIRNLFRGSSWHWIAQPIKDVRGRLLGQKLDGLGLSVLRFLNNTCIVLYFIQCWALDFSSNRQSLFLVSFTH